MLKTIAACETNKDKALFLLLAAIASVVLAVAIGGLAYLFSGPVTSGTWYNKYFILFAAMLLFSIALFFTFRKDMKDKPERVFLAVVLVFTMGSSILFDVNKVSWDAESHFRFMLSWTEPDGTVELNEAEQDAIYGYAARFETDIAALNDWKGYLNEAEGISTDESFSSAPLTSFYNRIASIPGSIVYMLCGALGVSFSITYVLTKLIYALIYSIVCYRGMKLLRSGKMIFASIAMLPAALFIAANYGYDYWVTCWILYAAARLLGELQRPDQQLTLKSALLMFGAFVVACGPKAIYFPLAALALTMPRSKFASSAHSRIFRAACIVVPLLIASSFLLNFVGSVSSGAETGDSRGGSDVSTIGQVQFILSDIPHYLVVLFGYLLGDYSYHVVHDTALWAYLGFPMLRTWVLTALIVAFVTVTDKEPTDKTALSNWKTRTWSLVVGVGTLCLVATSMYISYTVVASDTIAGVQPRYAFPLLVVLLFLGSPKLGGMVRVGHECVYNTAILALLTGIPYLVLWQTYIALLA